MTPSTRRRGLATAAAITLLAITGACSSMSSGDGDSSDAGGSADARERPADAAQAFSAADGETGAVVDEATGKPQAGQAGPAALQRAVISTGNVAMKSSDVGQAIFDVRKVVDIHRGEVQEDTTETDDDGDPLR